MKTGDLIRCYGNRHGLKGNWLAVIEKIGGDVRSLIWLEERRVKQTLNKKQLKLYCHKL